MSEKTKLIRTVYLYLFSLVGLVLIIISGVRFIDMGLKAWVFTEAESYVSYDYGPYEPYYDKEGKVVEKITEEEKIEAHNKQVKQRRSADAANALAQLFVGLPLYLYHWRMAAKKKEEES